MQPREPLSEDMRAFQVMEGAIQIAITARLGGGGPFVFDGLFDRKGHRISVKVMCFERNRRTSKHA